MTLSVTALQAALAQQTEQVFLACLTIEHDDLADAIRVVNNNEAVERTGGTYLAFPFEAVLPDDQGDQLPQLQIRIDNVSREVMAAIRALETPPTITLEIILASSPNTVESGPFELSVLEIGYDVTTIQATCGYEDMLNEPFPRDTFNPKNFPALF